MLHDHKPALDDALLAHYGIKGMKWGKRKQRTPEEQQRISARNKKVAKIAVGVTVAAGAVAVAVILSRNGGIKASAATAKAAAAKGAAWVARSSATAKKVADIPSPSPQAMLAEARNAAYRNGLGKQLNQQMTRKIWEDSAQLNMLIRNAQRGGG